MKHQWTLIAVLVCLSLLPANLSGQAYRFRNFGPPPESKMPDGYVYSLNQDLNGFLWIGTGSGLVKFDGFDFHRVLFPDSSASRYVSVIFRDNSGRIWLGCSDGSLYYDTSDGLVKLPDQGVQSINDIFENKDGNIWVIPQDKMIIRINSEKPADISKFNISRPVIMTTASLASSGDMLLGTQESLLWCTLDKDSLLVKGTVEGIDYTKVQVIRKLKDKDVWLIGTEGAGLYKLNMTRGKPVMERFSGHQELDSLDIKTITEDNNGNIWMSSYGSGVYQLSLSGDARSITAMRQFTRGSGLLGDNVRVRAIFQDMEGNIWMGYYGDGLSMLSSDAFSYYTPSENPEENSIIYISGKNNRYLLGTPRGYFIFNHSTGKSETFVNLAKEITGEISCYHSDQDNNIWIGTKGNGLYLKRREGSPGLFYRSGNTGEDYIRNITSTDTRLWLATTNGIVVLDRNSGAVIRKLRIEDRLPHNSINQIFLRKNGHALPATECDRLYEIDLQKGVTIGKAIMYGGSKNKVTCFDEDDDGGIWAGTAGNGVFYIINDSVTRITTNDGLLSNYCYSILADSAGTVWVGHERGFSKYDLKTGVIKALPTDFAKNGDCNANCLIEDDGRILLGTTEGLIIYERSRDRKVRMAPLNNIVSVLINNVQYPIRSSYSLKYKKYTIKIDYVGISLSDPEKVLYKTKVDNVNEDWSALRPLRSIEYPLSDGKYRFHLISVGEDGMSQKTPLSFDILIKKPYWRTWWFTLLVLMAAGGIVAIIVNERDKAQRKVKEYLETELAARTRLVLKQKDEIELQNIEITDSINYAKRIQSSILPDIARLKETFMDAFILFHPRDIVSGDFYWFDKISDEKFIIVCADSTGHGVPGAFMSMIGSTLLQDIISRKGITKPSRILSLLDKQIFSTLNQNMDVGVSNDGMDMVVCEIDVKSKLVRFASAMRPVIIVMGGESYYIKGNRCSVGGESVIEKYFDDQEYYLSEGDTIYMFSDGFPDQFGGADGKKMKIARMKKLIEQASALPMSEQKQIISDFFFEWKGDYEQVDDILLMGIRL
ncbi:MAG: two-component regulator propeller domain-containing protein [Bacteroidales bacterium]|jgi:ligand-binding sensor domain-containing protein/serine phosphatase RsbU (regulator of sigma subunit)